MTDKNNKVENSPIILDLNTVDFERNIEGEEIWQQDAVFEFNKRLTNTALQAKKYRNKADDNPIIIHDAIFIGGARGTGKTVFLQNIKGFWNAYKKENDLDINIHFCKSIDPTLLVDHDNFANVVIAHLYNEVEGALNMKNSESSSQDAFYSALRVVSQSLGKQEHLDDSLSGLDRIIKYRSGIQLSKNFESFIFESTKTIQVDAIVLPIDDIDMALERAHTILDVVRRILGCPLIIPVITGDLELYQPIIKKHFQKGGGKTNYDLIEPNQAEELTQAYLTKVLPHHNRLALSSIGRLLPKMVISEKNNGSTLNLDYSEYKQRVTKYFYGPLNGDERSCGWPEPKSAREVTQLIRDISPSNLSNKQRPMLVNRFKNWAMMQESGIAYSNLFSSQQVIDLMEAEQSIDINKLHAFNPLIQINDNKPKWNGKFFFNEQLINIESENSDNKLHQSIVDELKLHTELKISRSMPPVEFYTQRLSMTTDEEKDFKQDKLLLDIYTFNNFYQSGTQTRQQIFFSRAFEILTTSLLNMKDNKTDLTHKTISKAVYDIFNRAPFYTFYSLFPTKPFSSDIPSMGDEDIIDSNASIKKERIRSFLVEIDTWNAEYAPKLAEIESDSLIALFHVVFNKVFTQLNILRKKDDLIANDNLQHSIVRFQYILINAFASFLKPKNVAHQNVALTKKSETVFDFHNYINSSNPMKINVGYFFDFSDESRTGLFQLKKLNAGIEGHSAMLMQAIWNHPLFKKITWYRELSIDEVADFIRRARTLNDNPRSTEKERKALLDEMNLSAQKISGKSFDENITGDDAKIKFQKEVLNRLIN